MAASEQSKRVIILTGDAGFGHRRSANAIARALQETHGDECAVEIINPMDDERIMPFLRNVQTDHDRFARDLRDPYAIGWSASRAAVPSAGIEGAFSIMLFGVMWDIVRHQAPDAIVTTYPLFQSALATVFAVSRRRVPLLTVVTDLGPVHPLWFHKAASACLVASPIARDQALAEGLAPERVHITGIPIDPALAGPYPAKPVLRAQLGWRPDLVTVLAVGSRRVGRLIDALTVLNHAGLPLQMAVVAGSDASLYGQLQEIEWHLPVHLYNWVDNMGEMLHAADCVMTKAGGLIISESLACGLPLVLIEAMPDQELANVDFVVQAGAAEVGDNPSAVLEILYHWTANGCALLEERAEAAQAWGRPHAAYQVAQHAWRLARSHRRQRTRIFGASKV